MNCKTKTKAGNLCKAPVLEGRNYCLWHDPECAEARKQASRKGGLRRSIIPVLGRANIKDMNDIIKELENVTNALREGKVDAKTANSLIFAYKAMIDGYKTGKVAQSSTKYDSNRWENDAELKEMSKKFELMRDIPSSELERMIKEHKNKQSIPTL